jgi:superoxide reductase
MSNRRDFLKGSLALAGAVAASRVAGAQAETKFPAGLIYTAAAPGRWAGKEGTHAPKVTVEGREVTILTPHPMSEPHFIVKHTLLTADGQFLGEKTFTAASPKAESSYELPADYKGALWATSFCNLHDLWLTEFAV